MQARVPARALHVFPHARTPHLQIYTYKKFCKNRLRNQQVIRLPNSAIPVTMSEQHVIPIDRLHRLLHDPPNRWAMQKVQPDGKFDTVDTWSGGQRSARRWCEEHGIVPSAAADALLGQIPETGGFKDR